MTGNVVTETPTTEALLAEVEDQIQFHHISLEKLMIARSVILDTTRKLTKKAGKEASATLSLNAPAEQPGKGKKKGKGKSKAHVAKNPSPESIAGRALNHLREHGPTKSGDVIRALGVAPSSVHSTFSAMYRSGRLVRDGEGRYSFPPEPNGSHSPVAQADLSGGAQAGVH